MFHGRVKVTGAGDGTLCSGEVLPDSAGAMDENFVEPAVFGLVRIFVPKVPFAEDTGVCSLLHSALRQWWWLRAPCVPVQVSCG